LKIKTTLKSNDMKNIRLILSGLLLLAALLVYNFCDAQKLEGFGANAVGGSNSTDVYHVTTLTGTGPGSFGYGIRSNRTIVFDVSGIINGKSGMNEGRYYFANISYLTIDGNGKDVTIDNNNNGDAISFDGVNTHHIILKGLHVTDAGGDGINVVSGAHDILITNCSSYGNRDGNIDIAGDNSGITKNVTVQWCILGSGVANSSYSGDMLITGQNVSAHHNLFVPAGPNVVGERCPLVHCNYSPIGSPNADIRNNVAWKFGRNDATGSGYGADIAYSATANVVNNYYYSPSDGGNAVVVNGSYGSTPKGSAYASGNVSGNIGVNPNSQSNHAEYSIPAQYAITMQDACTAAGLVIAQAGPSPRNKQDNDFVATVTLVNCAAAPVNNPPVANAGSDVTITLPTSSAVLNGSGTDIDGSVSSYKWSYVSGPASYTLGTPNASTTIISSLIEGSYKFKLTVTDNSGATASDDVAVIVNPAPNQPPVVDAGTDQTTILPADSVILSGSGSDPDGTISSIQWSKVSGTGGTIVSPSAGVTKVIGLTEGTYIFRLTVKDNSGVSVSDNVTVNVNPAPIPVKPFAVYMTQTIIYSDSTQKVLPPIKF
jgi:hypothetical protein